MAKKSIGYREGDWVAWRVNDRFAVGLLARVNQDGIGVGYFFPWLFGALPKLESLRGARAEAAVLIHRFGGPCLKDGRWVILGPMPGWDRTQWPLPEFRHRDPVSGQWRIRTYGDDETLWIISDRPATGEQVLRLPDDGCAGALYIEEKMADLMGKDWVLRSPVVGADDLAAEQPAQHYLYFHDKELAEHAAKACEELGLRTVFADSVDEEKPWLIQAQHGASHVTEEQMEQVGEKLQARSCRPSQKNGAESTMDGIGRVDSAGRTDGEAERLDGPELGRGAWACVGGAV